MWLGIAGLALLAACGSTGTNGNGSPSDSASGARGPGRPSTTTAENTPAAGNGTAAGGSVRRVVVLGTSLTAGLGLDPDDAYPALLQAKADSARLPVTIVNAGLSGETSAGALRRATWVLEQPAALVILEVGANDGLRGVDPDSTYANLVRLVETVRAQRPGAAIALVQMEAPSNLGRAYTRRFHEAYVRASKATAVPLWPFLLDGVAGVARLNQADGIHPNPQGSRRVAANMWTSLEPALRALPSS